MKKFKKRISAALALVMILSAAACNDTSGEGGETTTTTQASTAQTTEEESETTESEEESEETDEVDETVSETETETGTEEPEDGTDPVSKDGDTGGLELPLVDEPVTITWSIASPFEGLTDSFIIQEINERTGLDLVLDIYPNATKNEKILSMISTGTVPDIFTGVLNLRELNEYGEQGAFAAINDYYDELPNFVSMYVDNPENNWMTYSYGSNQNNLYFWPLYNVARDVNHGFMYRSDIWEELDIEPWTDTESFLENLRAVKEAYPESNPWGSKLGAGMFGRMAISWGMNAIPFFFDHEDGLWKYAGAQEEYKDMLDFLKQAYDEGLLDPEFLTDSLDAWSAKVTTDKNFMFNDWIGRIELFGAQMRTEKDDWNLRFGLPIGSTGKQIAIPKVAGFGPTVAAGEKALPALQLLDYMLSPEGSELYTIGVEGENFEWDETGNPFYPELVDEPLVNIDLLWSRYGMWINDLLVHVDPRSIYFDFTEEEQLAQDLINQDDLYMPLDPIIKLSEEENSEYVDINTILKSDLESFSSNYVMSGADWDEFVSQSEAKGYKDAEQLLNDAQARYDAFLED